MKDLERFMRIANAQLRNRIGYKPQRTAVAGKMYVRWMKRKKNNVVHGTQKGQHSQEL
tara:strand:- start:348 stop:521 length:174 start_codon:yes stop_codon:yes gene_type:complete